MTENVRKTVLGNGVRIVTESIETVESVAIGLWVAAGSRDEAPHQRGISHFLEHMLFKGTERRPSPKIIADEMDQIGGYLNAFTDKEYTCYYARALREHMPVAIDILTDMFAHSIFDAEETARERKVVLEEIKRRDDDPEDLVHDLFAETLYPGHPLGLPVIGTAEIVSQLTPEALHAYVAQRCGPENVIIAGSGNLEHERVVALVQDALGHLKPGRPRESLPPLVPTPAHVEHSRVNEQVNFCIGARGYSQHDDARYPLALLDAILGGSMGARLFQEIREKRGLAYSVGSYCTNFREGGYFAAYGGTSPENYAECAELILIELEKVRAAGVTGPELERAKNQFRGQIVMAQESMSSRMNRLGKSEIYYDRVVPLDEVLHTIEAVTLDDIQKVAQEILPRDADGLTLAAVGPFRAEHKAALEEEDEEEEA